METQTTARRRPAKRREVATPARDHAGIARLFEADVVTGRFPCGRLFRAAVERQVRDLANPPAGYTFDAERGARHCRLAELLPYPEGPHRGEPFRLEPWQVWLLVTLHGWHDPVSGYPRFREADIWLPKGNGKSPMAALLAVDTLALSTEGPKVFSVASMQKQARLVFSAAQEMLRLAPAVRERFALVVGEHAIRGVGDNRVYEPVSAEAGSIEGIRPSLVVVDEVHVLGSRRLLDNVRSACAKVDGSLLVLISTAGMDAEGVGREQFRRAQDILEGRVLDETTFAVIASADPDDDPFSEATWAKANPNLGISVSLVGIRAAFKRAKEMPSERASVFAKHLNWWADGAVDAFLDLTAWDKRADPSLVLTPGEPAYLGVDLATTRDFTAAAAVQVRMVDGQRHYFVTAKGYLPERSITLDGPAGDSFRAWASVGYHLVLTPGEVMDFSVLQGDLEDLLATYSGSEVCVDPWAAAPLMADLMAKGHTVVEVRQGARTQSAAMKELEAATLSGRMHHDGNPLLRHCIGNLLARSDRNGNVAPDRADESRKIDLAVALVNALVRASVSGGGAVVTDASHYLLRL